MVTQCHHHWPVRPSTCCILCWKSCHWPRKDGGRWKISSSTQNFHSIWNVQPDADPGTEDRDGLLRVYIEEHNSENWITLHLAPLWPGVTEADILNLPKIISLVWSEWGMICSCPLSYFGFHFYLQKSCFYFIFHWNHQFTGYKTFCNNCDGRKWCYYWSTFWCNFSKVSARRYKV